MKYRKPAPEKQERRNDENALAKFSNLTLEQQEPGTVAERLDDSSGQSPHRRCPWSSAILPTYSDLASLQPSLNPQRSSPDRQPRIEDGDENEPPYPEQTAPTLTKRGSLLLLPGPSRAQQRRRQDPLCKVPSRDKVSKSTSIHDKSSTTRHFKVSKSGTGHFGRILKARQNYWAQTTTLETMLASVNERCKDDLDQTLTRRRRTTSPVATRGRSRSLVSRGERNIDDLADLEADCSPAGKNLSRTSHWASIKSYDFAPTHPDKALSSSISDCTTLVGDDYMDTNGRAPCVQHLRQSWRVIRRTRRAVC